MTLSLTVSVLFYGTASFHSSNNLCRILIAQVWNNLLNALSAEPGLRSHSLKVLDEDSGREEDFYFSFILSSCLLNSNSDKMLVTIFVSVLHIIVLFLIPIFYPAY